VLRLTILLILTAALSLAAPSNCVPGTLTDYLSLNTEGCRLGTRVISDFNLVPLTQGSSEIDPNSVIITPSTLGMAGSLLFTYNANGTILESIFQLNVTPDLFVREKVDLRLTGAGATGDGVVTGVDALCGGDLLVGLCTGDSQPLIALVTSNTQLPLASAVIGPRASYSLLHDVVVDAGLSGTASLTSAELTFTAVPEPATLLTLAAGLLSMFVLRHTFSKS